MRTTDVVQGHAAVLNSVVFYSITGVLLAGLLLL